MTRRDDEVVELGKRLWAVIAGREWVAGEVLAEVVPGERAGIVRVAERAVAGGYASAEELAGAIEPFVEVPVEAGEKESEWIGVKRFAREHRVLAIACVVMVGLLVVGGVVLAALYRGARRDVAEGERVAKTARAGERTAARDLADALAARADDLAAERFTLSTALYAAAALGALPEEGGRRPAEDAVRAVARSYLAVARIEPLAGLARERDIGAPVLGLSATADGALFASRSARQIKLWTASGEPAGALTGHKSDVAAVALSRDGKRCASAAGDELVVWDVETRRKAQDLARPSRAPALDVAFATDGSRVASAEADGSVTLWPLAGGAPRRLEAHRGEALAVVFAGGVVATGGADAAVRLWDAASGAPVGQLLAHSARILDLAASADGHLLISVGADRMVALWDVPNRQLISSLPGHTSAVTSAVFSADGELVLAAAADGTTRAWYTADGATAFGIEAHEHGASAVTLTADETGTRVVTGGADSKLRLWALGGAGRPRLVSLDAEITRVQMSHDDATVYAAGRDLKIHAFKVTGEALPPLVPGHVDDVTSLAVASDGALASTSRDGSAVVWRGDGAPMAPLRGHDGPVNGGAFSPDGTILATAGDDGTVRFWQAKTGKQLQVLRGPHSPATAIAFAPDGKRLATTHASGEVQIWAVERSTAKQERLLDESEPLAAVAFSLDGAYLVAGGRKGAIAWRTSDWDDVLAVSHGATITAIDFSADGSLATAGEDGTVRLWTFPDGDPLLTMRARTPALDLASKGDLAVWSDGPRLRFGALAPVPGDDPTALVKAAEKASGLKLRGFRAVR